MSVSVAVCDDLQRERIELARTVHDYFQERGLAVNLRLFADGDELLNSVSREEFQIIFLDIYMPGTSGMEAARCIRKLGSDCSIIFVTTSEDYGIESFAVQASDYLVKPYCKQDVAKALDWCLEQQTASNRQLSVMSEWEKSEVPLRHLQYIEIRGHRAHLHINNQTIVVRQGLNNLEADICDPDFLRCHRSYLVNMNFIQVLEKSFFRMSDGSLVPISSSMSSDIRERFMDWTFIKTWKCR